MATSSGYNSNYNDSGYDCSFSYSCLVISSAVVIPSGQTIAVAASELYTTTAQCGVFMIDLSAQTTYPIHGSLTSLAMSGMPQQKDSGYIIYPGYAIQLFSSTAYTGDYSVIVINNTTSPILTVNNGTSGNGESPTNPGFPSTGYYTPYSSYSLANPTYYSCNQTESIYVWFRGSLISLLALSST